MATTHIAWLVSTVLWGIFTIIIGISRSHDEMYVLQFATVMQFICLGFMWFFLGINNGWW